MTPEEKQAWERNERRKARKKGYLTWLKINSFACFKANNSAVFMPYINTPKHHQVV